MVRLPRDLSGRELAHALRRYGYAVTRETGSHMRLTTRRGGEHHVTVPDHASLRIGTLAGILADVRISQNGAQRARRRTIRRLVRCRLRSPGGRVAGNFDVNQAVISPDGRWVAYTSNETGRSEVYVQSFPHPRQKRAISVEGGTQPRWRGDAKELI